MTTIVTDCDPIVPTSYSKDVPPNAYFYEHRCGERQKRLAVRAGSRLPWPGVNNAGLNDRITTVIVPPNVSVDLYADKCLAEGQCKHQRRLLGPGHFDLPGEKYLSGRGMNDSISEISVLSVKPHQEWLRDCCLGKVSPVESCANFANPNGADCISVLSDYCSNPKNFFSPDCKRWVSNLKDAQRDNIARAACPSATTEEQKDWCACYLLKDIPPELEKDEVMRGLWACLDPVCNNSSRSLQPFAKDCPSSLTLCNQRDIVTKLSSSEIGNQRLANECGNITVPSGPSGPSGPSRPSTPVEPVISRNWILAGAGIGFLLLLLLLVGILLALRRK